MKAPTYFLVLIAVSLGIAASAAQAQFHSAKDISKGQTGGVNSDTKMGNINLSQYDALPKAGFGGSYIRSKKVIIRRSQGASTTRLGEEVASKSEEPSAKPEKKKPHTYSKPLETVDSHGVKAPARRGSMLKTSK